MVKEIPNQYNDIDLRTLKIVMKEFYYHLSELERDKYFSLYFIGIKKMINVQKSILQNLRDNKINDLQIELDLLKKSI